MDTPSTQLADLPVVVTSAFTKHYGYRPSHIARAPGRVNIIGEHTDYNDGFVLPAAIDRAIYIAGRLRADNKVSVQSLDYGGISTFTLDELQDKGLPHFTRFPRGVMWILKQQGHVLHGLDVTIAGNVPSGAGFSSSAAIEVAMTELVTALHGIPMTQRQKALLGVEVEHQFIGVPTGVMDEMISALGQANHALLIDCRSLEATPVPLPRGFTILTLDTGKRHELVNSEYGIRRRQCEEAARLLGVRALRDMTPDQLEARSGELPTWNAKRARHVVYEDARTLAAVEALKLDDLTTVGRLMNESHASLRDLYEVSIKELDIMADLAQQQPGCYGARMMGGGFGGAVIALVQDEAVKDFAAVVAQGYETATRIVPAVYSAKAGAGSSASML